MTYIMWSSDLSVGVAQFDEEHKQLGTDLINDMHHNMHQGMANEALGEALDKLFAQLVVHLDHEEECFDELHYPRAGAHKARHEHLKTRIRTLRSEVGNKTGSARDILHVLRDVMLDHINEEDKSYSAYLNEQGIH